MSLLMKQDKAAPNVTEPLSQAVSMFVEKCIIPNEALLAQGDDAAENKREELRLQAQQAGLYGLFYPTGHGGKIGALSDYLAIAEQEGRSEHGPGILGCHATLDAHMLYRHGNALLQQQFLLPLIEGRAVAAYGMSEPDSIGSIPATINTRATLRDGVWHVSGRKWFISRLDRASFVTVVARTEDTVQGNTQTQSGLSMIVVPTDAPGFKIERRLDILGDMHGECEISFDNVQVPAHHLLGPCHQGEVLMRQRLGLGRVLRAIHWLALAQRCFDLMRDRIRSDRGQRARLAEKQLVRQQVFQVAQAILSARALLELAARRIDAQQCSDIEVNMAKVAASQALSLAADSAIQIFGAEGLSNLTPLSRIYRLARTTHILDGSDEVLISAVGRRLLDMADTEPLSAQS